ncbi:hypothetical protein B0I22_0369 [Epilithonimonas xixisoli]|uniref:Uncharacterized protein n=1 Tax=Epilithonimonas xixisoli TaxID=1476462 RepID=A0A4R8I8A0_9FLAO|nr:hypothetical protein B0I22_0369 [Epilithonimonas xixisoli]
MFQLCEAQPDLSGALFLHWEKPWQKKAGTEGGKAAQKINFIDTKI